MSLMPRRPATEEPPDLSDPAALSEAIRDAAKKGLKAVNMTQRDVAGLLLGADEFMVSRSLKSGLTRDLANVLDSIVGEPVDGWTFSEWRDWFLLAQDRARSSRNAPPVAGLPVSAVDHWRCPVSVSADLPRSREGGQRAALVHSMFTVANCPEAADIVAATLDGSARAFSIYSLMGAYDLMARYWLDGKVSAEKLHERLIAALLKKRLIDAPDAKSEFTKKRLLLASRWASPQATGTMLDQLLEEQRPEFERAIFDARTAEDVRVERSYILVQVPLERTGRWPSLLKDALTTLEEEYGSIVESVAVNSPRERDDSGAQEGGLFMIELLATCAQRYKISQLNRDLEDLFILSDAQKWSLTCYDYVESAR
jgi:hypothetical protein